MIYTIEIAILKMLLREELITNDEYNKAIETLYKKVA